MPKHLPREWWRLLLAFGGVVVGSLVALPFGARIIEALTAPILSAGGTLVFTSAIEPMMLAVFKGPFYGGVFLAAPWFWWQLWLSLAPERHRRERRVALPVVALATALFYGGAAFAYGVVLPRTMPAMPAGVGGGIGTMLTLDAATALVVKNMIGYGLAFELPLLVALAAIMARGSTQSGAAATNPGSRSSAPPSP